jgi:hypothetical protein
MAAYGYDRPICALAGCDSCALDCGSWGTERQLSPVFVSSTSGCRPVLERVGKTGYDPKATWEQ